MEIPESLVSLFESMDTEKTGFIKAINLQKELSNGTDRPFDIKTCDLMIAMFCKDNSRKIDMNQFIELWHFVNDWISVFEASDVDGTGEMKQPELNSFLNNLGYRFSDNFYNFIDKKFNLSGKSGLNFDEFLLLCMVLLMLTGIYTKINNKNDSSIELNIDEFLSMFLEITSL